MTTHGFAAFSSGSPLNPLTYEPGPLGPWDADVEISHCGICHSDIHLIDNDWNISRYPFIPGHEIVGRIVDIGSAVTGLTPGVRVGLGWQSGSCLDCEPCRTGKENLCAHSRPTCVGRHGGFASHVRTDARFLFPIPESLDSMNAAPLLCAGITVFSPLLIHGVKPTDRVGVIGIGGLGHLALQFAHALGCHVTALTSSPDKIEEARRFGADEVIVGTEPTVLARHTGSLDYVLSTVTAPLNWMDLLGLLRPEGRLNFVGGTVGPLNIPAGALITGQKTLSGTAIGGRTMMTAMLDFASRHGIVAKTQSLPLSEVNTAVEKVRRNEARYRMVLTMQH